MMLVGLPDLVYDLLGKWSFMFPFACVVLLWLSVDLSLLIHVGEGGRRRQRTRRGVETVIRQSPAIRRVKVKVVRRRSARTDSASPIGGEGTAAVLQGSPKEEQKAAAAPPHPSCSVGRGEEGIEVEEHWVDVCRVLVPTATRIATKAIRHRAVVVVGGDFARSPRMQYHAMSLAKSGWFDQVTLVGYDEGNTLSEALLHCGAPEPEEYVVWRGKVRRLERLPPPDTRTSAPSSAYSLKRRGMSSSGHSQTTARPRASEGMRPHASASSCEEEDDEGNDEVDVIVIDEDGCFTEGISGCSRSTADGRQGGCAGFPFLDTSSSEEDEDNEKEEERGRCPSHSGRTGEEPPQPVSLHRFECEASAAVLDRLQQEATARFTTSLSSTFHFTTPNAGASSPTFPVSEGEGRNARSPGTLPRIPHSKQNGCQIHSKYLVRPPAPPLWLHRLCAVQGAGPLYWVLFTLYRVVLLTFRFSSLLMRAMVMSVNSQGQLEVTSCVLFQTPPCIPVLLLAKYIIRPIAFWYSCVLYYGFIIPASYLNADAMREMNFTRKSKVVQRDEKKRAASSPSTDTTDDEIRSEVDASSRDPPKKHYSAEERTGVVKNSGSGEKPAAVLSPFFVQASLLQSRRIPLRVFYPTYIVDWHNFGYTILEAANRPRGFVALYRFLELRCGAGDINLTVSKAMKAAIETRVLGTPHRNTVSHTCSTPLSSHHFRSPKSPEVHVLYDIAPSFFAAVSRRRFIKEVLIPISKLTAAVAILGDHSQPSSPVPPPSGTNPPTTTGASVPLLSSSVAADELSEHLPPSRTESSRPGEAEETTTASTTSLVAAESPPQDTMEMPQPEEVAAVASPRANDGLIDEEDDDEDPAWERRRRTETPQEQHHRLKEESWGISPPPAWVLQEIDVDNSEFEGQASASHTPPLSFIRRHRRDVDPEKSGSVMRVSDHSSSSSQYSSPLHSNSSRSSSDEGSSSSFSTVPRHRDESKQRKGTARRRDQRAASASSAAPPRRKGLVVVGSTSWTEEDDYTVLVEALQRLDFRLSHESSSHGVAAMPSSGQVGPPGWGTGPPPAAATATGGGLDVPPNPSPWQLLLRSSAVVASHSNEASEAAATTESVSSTTPQSSLHHLAPVAGDDAMELPRQRSVSPSPPHVTRSAPPHSALPEREPLRSSVNGMGFSSHLSLSPLHPAAPLDVWVLITGKGPARARFEAQVEAAHLSSHVVVSTLYLQSYQQYSVTLGAADVGLCLHHSTSGLDLPMKAVDMLGAGLPVMALEYEAIPELLGHVIPTTGETPQPSVCREAEEQRHSSSVLAPASSSTTRTPTSVGASTGTFRRSGSGASVSFYKGEQTGGEADGVIEEETSDREGLLSFSATPRPTTSLRRQGTQEKPSSVVRSSSTSELCNSAGTPQRSSPIASSRLYYRRHPSRSAVAAAPFVGPINHPPGSLHHSTTYLGHTEASGAHLHHRPSSTRGRGEGPTSSATVGPTVRAYEYGWTFQTSRDLEELLAAFVGCSPSILTETGSVAPSQHNHLSYSGSQGAVGGSYSTVSAALYSHNALPGLITASRRPSNPASPVRLGPLLSTNPPQHLHSSSSNVGTASNLLFHVPAPASNSTVAGSSFPRTPSQRLLPTSILVSVGTATAHSVAGPATPPAAHHPSLVSRQGGGGGEGSPLPSPSPAATQGWKWTTAAGWMGTPPQSGMLSPALLAVRRRVFERRRCKRHTATPPPPPGREDSTGNCGSVPPSVCQHALTWEEQWDAVVDPLLEQLMRRISC